MGNSRLNEIATEKREQLLSTNDYGFNNQYGASHPNATQETTNDDPLNLQGRGTGGTFDTSFNAGNYIDKNGIPSIPNSGRRGVFSNLYNPNNIYECF
jgi:hypothetical protein